MNEVEETLEMYEAKEAAYQDGMFHGVLYGIPIGTTGTLLIAWLTADTWLKFIN